MTLSFILLAYTGVGRHDLRGRGRDVRRDRGLRHGDRAASPAGVSSCSWALIGVVMASVVGMFWQNDGLQFVLGFIGVIVFTGLTAYDAQRLKADGAGAAPGGTASYAIVGALTLYLDFVNLFLMLLRFTGNRRQ